MNVMRIKRCGFILVISLLLLLCNILFWKHIESNAVLQQSGELYLERAEYVFTPTFTDSTDYVEQHFFPQESYLKSIKVRLGVGWAGLPDKFVVLLELKEGDNVLCSEEVVLYNEDNWGYHDFEVEQYVVPGNEYILSVRQLQGPYKEESDDYKFSYTVFHAVQHITENDTQYYFNGDAYEGEFEVSYIYKTYDKNLLYIWLAVNVTLVLLVILCWLLNKKLSSKPKQYIALVLWGVFPIILYILCELILGNFATIEWVNHLKNLVIYYLIYIVLTLLFGGLHVLWFSYMAVLIVFTLIQYFVTQFRGRSLYLHDLLAARTAAAVAGSYDFQLNPIVFISIMICIALILVAYIFTSFYHLNVRKKVYGVTFVGAVGLCLIVFQSHFLLSVNMWDISETYQKGGNILTLLSQIPYAFVKEPNEYSVSAVKEIVGDYVVETKEQNIPNNIILIMNETFSDLEYINEIQTEQELLPYWKSMEENVVRGWLYVPVFGAGTANSEYEVLTGNEVEFLAQGSTAYQMNVAEGEFGLVSILEEQGYITSALHPNEATNWSRNNVYKHMGFDEFYSKSNWGSWENIRWCASDRSAYQKVMDIDSASDDKQFIFLVTMQNHGGYASEWDDFSNEVSLNYENDYPETEQYLSLLQESDRAFYELLEHYKDSEEPTMIVMFGDHQAAIEEEFYEELYGKDLEELTFEEEQSRYVTPFVVWTNYDIEEQSDIEMSANYFGSFILDQAELKLTAYNQFLLYAMEEIPVIGIGGIKTKEGVWYQWEDVPQEYEDIINQYKILQYNNVFDRKHRVEECFTIQ